MKAKVYGLLFWVVAGAAVGWIHGSGIIGLFKHSSRDIEHRDYWKPVTEEQYRDDVRRYPVYGAAAGGVIWLILSFRVWITSGRRPNDPVE